MRRVVGLILCLVLAMTVVVRAAPRACGSTFACCEAEAPEPVAAAGQPTTEPSDPSCCEPPAPRFSPAKAAHLPTTHPTTHPAADEAMSCCTSLALPPTHLDAGVRFESAATDRVVAVRMPLDTRVIEPATPPPRPIG